MYRQARRVAGRRRRTPRRNRRARGNYLSKRIFNIRNSAVFRPRKPGYSNLALSFARRLIAYPSSGAKPLPDKPAPDSSWWLDKLQWFGSLALQLVGVFLAAEKSALSLNFAITGAGTCFPITTRTLLTTTPIATRHGDDVMVPFEQAKILWIKATVTPIVDASIVVSWSPTLQEHSVKWHSLGDQGEEVPKCVAFVLAFSDMALAKADRGGLDSKEYNPGKSGFEMYLDGQVAVRQPGVSYFKPDLEYSDPTMIKVLSHGDYKYARLEDVEWNNGFGSIDKKNLVHALSAREVLSLENLAID
ncbi:unnamed protein product, partial [Brenthis ino]